MKEIHETEHGDPAVVHEPDGCPTEGAVLKREWRRLTKELAEARAPIAQPADAATAQESMDVHLREARAEIARLRNQLKQSDDYIKKMDAVIDDERVANSCINPLEDLKRAVAKLKSDRATAEKKARELGAILDLLENDAVRVELERHHSAPWVIGIAGRTVFGTTLRETVSQLLPPTPSQDQAGGVAACTNHYADGSKIFPNRDCCTAQPAGEGAALLPFDLAKALAGAKVVTRDGQEVTELEHVQDHSPYPVRGRIGEYRPLWTEEGRYQRSTEDRYDLFLAPGTGADTEGEG